MAAFFIAAAIAVICIIGLIASVIGAFISSKHERENLDNYDTSENKLNAITARVVSRQAHIERSGSYKTPDCHLAFYVTFQKDDGSTAQYPVSQEIFEKCIPNTTGMLVTINDHFLDFGEGEDIQ